MKNILIAIILVMMPLFGTILSRSTFEEWEGSLDWTATTGGNGAVVNEWEDPDNDYQTQSHGRWSLSIYDSDNQSYASASKIFSNSASEYMTEFYIWIPVDHQPIDSFPLCVLWNVVVPETLYPDSKYKTDIALVLDSVGSEFLIHVQDADSIHHNATIIDSTDRWYKIQIYRHDGVVDFYLDGDSIDTYSPMHSNYVSNKIVLGTTQADSLCDGEVFYDDVIISTVPSGEHPRLLFKGSTEIQNIRNRKNDNTTTILGKSFQQMAGMLVDSARYWFVHDTVFQGHNVSPLAETVWSYYPYSQPPPHNTFPNFFFWTGMCRKILLRLETWAFIYFLYPDSTHYQAKAETALVSISSNWRQWADPQIHSGTHYSGLETDYLVLALTLAYDMIYDSLNNYQKLTIENSLYSLGLGQLFLNATYEYGNDPFKWPNGYAWQNGAFGLGSVAVSPVESAYVDTALARAHTFFDSSVVCDTMGGYVEGMLYGSFAVDGFTTFFEAYNRNPTNPTNNPYVQDSAYLKKYPYARLYSLLPGGQSEVNFCDSWGILEWNAVDEVIRLAAEYQDEHMQWYLKEKGDFNANKTSFGFWHTFAPYLWLDTDVNPVIPDNLSRNRYYSNIGWVEFRTGWQDDDCLLALKCGHGWQTGNCYNHSHYDQTHFALGKNSKWLISEWGYGQKYANWHNVVTVDTDTAQIAGSAGEIIVKYMDEDDDYGYVKMSAADCYDNLDQYLREVVFLMDAQPFVVLFDRLKCTGGSAHSLNWWLHTFGTVNYNETDSISIHDGAAYLDVKIMLPGGTDIDTSKFPSGGASDTLIFLNVRKDSVNTAKYLAVMLPHDGTPPSAEKIAGSKLVGVKAHNTLVMFSDTLGDQVDSVPGGKYKVSVADSLLNIVCDLVADTSYIVITKKGSAVDSVDTLLSNEVGILSFTLYDTGTWNVIITLARATGSIQINKSQSFCNMPYAALDMEVNNPFNGESVDSMKIWQNYMRNDTLFTDSTGWVAYDSTYFWSLRQGETTDTVYARFMCDGWNESVDYADLIILDTTMATGSFVINNDNKFTNNSSVMLKNSLADAGSGMSRMRFGNQYLKNLVKNSDFDTTTYWKTDSAIYHDSLNLFEIPVQTTGNFFYQTIPADSLEDFEGDTLLLWIDLVSDGFTGTGKVEFRYIYSDTSSRGAQPNGASMTIPQGTNAKVSHYNLASYFKFQPDSDSVFVSARIGIWVEADSENSGRLFIDNLRLDVVGPANGFTKFETYDSLKSWTLTSGNGARKAYGQFADGAGNETGISFDTIIVDTTKPARKITSPQNGQTISNTIEIKGWAYDYADPQQHFQQYELKYASTGQPNWYGVFPDSLKITPVNQTFPPRRISFWHTDSVTEQHGDGWYVLKLTVQDSAANYRDTSVTVNIDNRDEGKGEMAGFSNYLYGLTAGNEIYIGEIQTGNIYKYNQNYQVLDTFSMQDSAGIGYPLAMAFGDAGKLWVVNLTSQTVNRYNNQGNLELRFTGNFSQPSGIALDSTDNIWVSDRMHHKIKKFDAQGNQIFAFGTKGSVPGKINEPLGIAVSNDKIYIADSKNKRVSVFDTIGNFIAIIGDSAGLSLPFGVAVDSTGCVFVSDIIGNKVIEFEPYGSILYVIDSLLDAPSCLALSPDDKILYVSDTKHKRVLAYQVRGDPPEGGGGPMGGEVALNLAFRFEYIYPNPAKNMVKIRFNSPDKRCVELKMYDATGRLVHQRRLSQVNIGMNEIIIETTELSSGIYFVMLDTGMHKQIEKLIMLR